jgi:hypothetical protein
MKQKEEHGRSWWEESQKNKNMNKLTPDQIPTFGPDIVPIEAVIRQIDNNQKSNNHARFKFEG